MTEEGNNLRHQFLQCWFLKQSQFCQARQCIQSFANNKLFSVTQTLQRIKQELAISWRKKQPKCNYTSQNHYNTSTPSDVTWEILIIEGKSTEKLVSGTLHHATVSRLLENQWGRTQPTSEWSWACELQMRSRELQVARYFAACGFTTHCSHATFTVTFALCCILPRGFSSKRETARISRRSSTVFSF